jgi:hypothetical protein
MERNFALEFRQSEQRYAEAQARAAEIRARREARGMNDPLNRLSANIDRLIAEGAEPVVEVVA